MRMPFRNNKIFDAVLVCLLFYISFCYFLYGYRYFDMGTYNYDEGIVIYGALRVLEGGIPYKDFWTPFRR